MKESCWDVLWQQKGIKDALDAVNLNWSSQWQVTVIDKAAENFILFRGDVEKA